MSNLKTVRFDGVLYMEVPARFELADQSFADSCLTTWLRYHMK